MLHKLLNTPVLWLREWGALKHCHDQLFLLWLGLGRAPAGELDIHRLIVWANVARTCEPDHIDGLWERPILWVDTLGELEGVLILTFWLLSAWLLCCLQRLLDFLRDFSGFLFEPWLGQGHGQHMQP